MNRIMLHAKIHRATITGVHLNYEGSVSICPLLRQAVDLYLYEKVLIANVETGSRFETYVMDGKEGEICLNGAASRLALPGDKVIIMAFAEYDNMEAFQHQPKVVLVDSSNRIVSVNNSEL